MRRILLDTKRLYRSFDRRSGCFRLLAGAETVFTVGNRPGGAVRRDFAGGGRSGKTGRS